MGSGLQVPPWRNYQIYLVPIRLQNPGAMGSRLARGKTARLDALLAARPPGAPPGEIIKLIDRRGTTRAEDAQGTPTQSHISPSILVYEDYWVPITVQSPGAVGARVARGETARLDPLLAARAPGTEFR